MYKPSTIQVEWLYNPISTFTNKIMDTHNKIKQQLEDHLVVLYMKGTPIFPQCGFSAKATSLLRECLEAAGAKDTDVLYVNVLEDAEIREGIKQYGQWPTIPQLYIQGELIGGCDIMMALFESGELQKQVETAVASR
jgi:monothiol glutaredoxin